MTDALKTLLLVRTANENAILGAARNYATLKVLGLAPGTDGGFVRLGSKHDEEAHLRYYGDKLLHEAETLVRMEGAHAGKLRHD